MPCRRALPSDETEFNAVELDVTGLHAFADMPSVRVEMSDWGKTPTSFVYDPPDARNWVDTTPLPGEVRFDPLATLPTFGGPDISVTTNTRLRCLSKRPYRCHRGV